MSKIIKGAGGGGGKGKGGSARVAVEAPDSLRSIQYANVLDLISEGEIEGLVDGARSIFLDDTPLQNSDNTYNFTGVSVATRNGLQAQTHIEGFAGAESESPVGVEVTSGSPIVRTITNVNNDAVRITLSTPQLTQQNTTNGDINGTSVEVAIDVQTDGGGYVAQEMRREYDATTFAIGAISSNTVASTKFNIRADWSYLTSTYSPQTLTVTLQYRLQGNTTWNDYEVYTFSGVGSLVANRQSIGNSVNSYWGYSIGGYGISYSFALNGTTSKTFNATLPSGLYEFRLIYSGNGTSAITYGETYSPRYTDIISGKTTSKYQRSYYINLPTGAEWDIRVRRITADSTSSALQNKTFWDSYTEIIDAKLSYPNSALIGLQIDSQQFSRIPVRGYEVKGMKVQIPSNYNPLTRVYTGTWNGSFTVAWTDNPAWILYDLVTNDRYGLGELISASMVDKWGLYSIAQYCDEMVSDGFGGVEPRFTCNLYLQSREQAYQVVTNIASIFRAMVYWSTGSVFLSQDAPKDVSQIFSQSNVIDGMFSYAGSSGRVRHTVALVSWNDPQDGYLPKIEYVSDNDAITRYGIVQTEITAIGCTSRGQAHRIGKWLIYSEQNETETITFKAGLDSVFLQAGDVIETNDSNRAGKRLGGRIISATTTQVVLDAAITIESGKTYEISCKLADGTIETKAITNAAGTTATINVATAFSSAPEAYAMWLVAISDLVPEKWRVVSISETDTNEIEISALAYNEDKYDIVEQDIILNPTPISIINANKPSIPSSVNVVESLYLAGLGVVGVKASVSWNSDPFVSSYIVSYRLENNTEQSITTDKNSVELLSLAEGRYTFKVIALDSLGRRSEPATVLQDILGKTIPPVEVSGLAISPLGSIGLFTWTQATDLDVLVGGSIRFRYSPDTLATWEEAQDMANIVAGNATTTTLPLQAGIYMAKFLDSSGNYSTNATSVITNAANVLALNFVEEIDGHPNWTGTKTDTQYDSGYGGILLGSAELWDNAELIDGDDDVDYGNGGVASSGSYYMGEIDLLSVQTLRISSLIKAQAIDFSALWDSDELIDAAELVDSGAIDDVSAAMWYRSSNDGATYGNWNKYTLADVTARSFQFELRLTSGSTYHNILVEEATAGADVPDRIESGDDIPTGGSSYVVTYNKPFIFNPAVGISAQNMATGDYYTITSKSVAGFTISFYNSSNTLINKTFDYIAKGY